MRTASRVTLAALLACVAIGACSQKQTASTPSSGSARQPATTSGQPFNPGTGNGGGFRRRGVGGMDQATFVQRFQRRIMRADANGDGRVTLSEWLAWRRTRPNPGRDPAHRFKVLDMNGDAVITADDLAARGARVYARRVRNGDLGGGGGGRGGQNGGMNGRGGGQDDQDGDQD